MHDGPARAAVLVAILVAFVFPYGGLRGQATSAAPDSAMAADGAMDGIVVDRSNHGLAGVEVTVLDAKLNVKTNSTGNYRIERIEAGQHLVRYRRLGMQPVSLWVIITPREITGADVVMGTNRLATVDVTAASGHLMTLPSEFVQHMRSGMGHYITEDEIASRQVRSTDELFRAIPGVIVASGQNPGQFKVSSGRGINSFLADPCPAGIPLYVNGVQAVGPVASHAASLSMSTAVTPVQSVDIVRPSEIAGIEVYVGPAGLPAGIPPSVCGAIIIWTK
ncbi:MAG: TonB-dependent receptor [Gemmatimonadota bacterium]|nr:TonB-dependent receptor [Gemmatimonadota bacterium]